MNRVVSVSRDVGQIRSDAWEVVLRDKVEVVRNHGDSILTDDFIVSATVEGPETVIFPAVSGRIASHAPLPGTCRRYDHDYAIKNFLSEIDGGIIHEL